MNPDKITVRKGDGHWWVYCPCCDHHASLPWTVWRYAVRSAFVHADRAHGAA